MHTIPFALSAALVIVLNACNEPVEPTPPVISEAAIDLPMRTVRLSQLKEVGDKPARVYLDAKELSDFLGDAQMERYDPALHDSLLADAVSYTPIDPDRPGLGGTIDVPCMRMCKDENYVYSCECPPASIPEPGGGGGGGTIEVPTGRCYLVGNRCLGLGCTTCRRRAVSILDRVFFIWCDCQ